MRSGAAVECSVANGHRQCSFPSTPVKSCWSILELALHARHDDTPAPSPQRQHDITSSTGRCQLSHPGGTPLGRARELPTASSRYAIGRAPRRLLHHAKCDAANRCDPAFLRKSPALQSSRSSPLGGACAARENDPVQARGVAESQGARRPLRARAGTTAIRRCVRAEVPRKPGCLAEVSDPRAIAILDAYLSGDEEFELESLAVRAGQSSDVGREMRRHDLADFFAGTGDVRPVPGSPTLRESQLHTRTT